MTHRSVRRTHALLLLSPHPRPSALAALQPLLQLGAAAAAVPALGVPLQEPFSMTFLAVRVCVLLPQAGSREGLVGQGWTVRDCRPAAGLQEGSGIRGAAPPLPDLALSPLP